MWYPFFKQGIQDGQKQAIQGVKPITSHFKKKTSISRSYLPPRFTSHYNGLKCDAKQRHRKYNWSGRVPDPFGDSCLDCRFTYVVGLKDSNTDTIPAPTARRRH
eukprot:5809478-Ditylum_brightwellii.AAC.1